MLSNTDADQPGRSVPARWRWNSIGAGMLAVAACALVFALGPWAVVLVWLLLWPALLVALSIPLAPCLGGTRLRAAVWLCAAYPWGAMVVGLTLLGHPDSPVVEFARSLVGLGLGWAVLGGLGLGFVEVLLTVERREPDQGRQVARLVLLPLASWAGAGITFLVVAGVILALRG